MGVPSGTVTFLLTDIAGSTRLWERDRAMMGEALARHDTILREVIGRHGGFVFATGGDGYAAAFGRAGTALACAAEAQRALAGAACPPVRMAVHTGEAEERDGDYFGPAVNRTARLRAIGHGGQVLVSLATRELSIGVELRDLGIHRLRDLSEPERVFQLVIAGQEVEFPLLSSLDTRATNLPVQLTSFVGRSVEVNTVRELLLEHRLVTLTGVGGVGKTRLAVQVAAEAVDRFADGVWLVELASITAPRVVDAIARVLGVELLAGVSVEASLLEAVSSRALLIVLDNCEHVVRAVRRVATELLRSGPGISILATSREGLRVGGEQLYSVPSLEADAAVQLFVERARAVDAGFVLNESDEAVAAALCDRLDGVPLAIELAAARARMFSVVELARRVEQRFRLLTGGRGDVERHQTLRAAIDWSYELLDERERQVFARLSVFAGGGSLDAIESVMADEEIPADMVVELLAGLVDKSLVLADRARADTRYEMQETIRQYAQDRLVDSGEADAVRARHGRWFAEFARRAGRGLYSPDELVWDERLRAEVDNLQIAVGWAAGTGEADVAMRIGGSFPRQATTRPLLGTAHLAEVALGVEGAGRHSAYARVLAEAGWAAANRGERAKALELLHRSIGAQRAGARFAAAAFIYLFTVEEENRLETATEGLRLAEATGDPVAATGLRTMYAVELAFRNETATAREQAQRALDDARALRQPTLEIGALYALAATTARTDPEDALALLHTSRELGRYYHNEAEQGATLGLLAYVEAAHGSHRNAVEAMRELAVTQLYSPTVWPGYYLGISAFSRVGRPDLVALCEGNSRAVVRQTAYLPYSELHAEETAEARAILGDEQFEQLTGRGAAMTRDDFNAMLLREIDAILDDMHEAGTP